MFNVWIPPLAYDIAKAMVDDFNRATTNCSAQIGSHKRSLKLPTG
jgi:hypothetical protein